MNQLVRLLHMYSLWSIVLVVFWIVFLGSEGGKFRQFLRWNTLLVMTGVIVTSLMSGFHFISAVIADFFRLRVGISPILAYIIDIVCHIVPVWIVGLPRSTRGLGTALFLATAWYAIVRSWIHEIYVPWVPTHDYDRFFVVTVGILLATAGVGRAMNKTG